MASENDNNRSSALSPEALAMIHTATAAAVQEAISSLFQNFMPALKDMALTPEKIREANRPYVDPLKAARDLRESLKSKKEEIENQKRLAAFRASCSHTYNNGITAICLVHNQPDHQPRGICVLCSDWIHPKEWRIGIPTEKEPNGHAYLVEPHKDYSRVMTLEVRS
jgi:hypothetical protein